MGLMMMYLLLRTFHKMADLHGLTTFLQLPRCEESEMDDEREPIVENGHQNQTIPHPRGKDDCKPLDPGSQPSYNTINKGWGGEEEEEEETLYLWWPSGLEVVMKQHQRLNLNPHLISFIHAVLGSNEEVRWVWDSVFVKGSWTSYLVTFCTHERITLTWLQHQTWTNRLWWHIRLWATNKHCVYWSETQSTCNRTVLKSLHL